MQDETLWMTTRAVDELYCIGHGLGEESGSAQRHNPCCITSERNVNLRVFASGLLASLNRITQNDKEREERAAEKVQQHALFAVIKTTSSLMSVDRKNDIQLLGKIQT